MSVKSLRARPPRGADRTPLPQLGAILRRQGRTAAWLNAELGMSHNHYTNSEKAGGWVEADVVRIMALLGVTREQLTARALDAPGASETAAALLQQPELARLSTDTAHAVAAAVHQHLSDAITRAVEETVRALATGSVPMRASRVTPADVRTLERANERPALVRRGRHPRG